MRGKEYSPQELEQFLAGLNQNTPLSELGVKMGRTKYGIASKMRLLAKQDPQTWSPERIYPYVREEIRKHKGNRKEQKKRWKVRRKGELQEKKLDKSLWLEFGKGLADFLTRYPGNKKEFALKMNVHPTFVSHILAGRRGPTKNFLREMSERFQISYGTLKTHRLVKSQ